MTVTVRSFSKINLGLFIGPPRPDGFHDLRTVYQTIALHDRVTVTVGSGAGIEIRSRDSRVPTDESNTCYRIIEASLVALGLRKRVKIEIEKWLPVQGGLGGASGNAVAALLGLERALKKIISGRDRLRLAAEVGSDLPLFLVGGTVLGVGRGEEVYPLPDLPQTPCVIATPEISVSTPRAFAEWDQMADSRKEGGVSAPNSATTAKLTLSAPSDRMNVFSRKLCAWLSGSVSSGASARRGGRAEISLLDLVRTGIENDFEQVVFPKYPELCEVKRVLVKSGAIYASLSGSGSAVYGLFPSRETARRAAARLAKEGVPAVATTTLNRTQYWKKTFA